MKKNVRDIAVILFITVPFFIGLLVAWHFSPMYKETKAEQREAVREHLLKTYYFGNTLFRQQLIEEYDFSPEEITPGLFLEKYSGSSE